MAHTVRVPYRPPLQASGSHITLRAPQSEPPTVFEFLPPPSEPPRCRLLCMYARTLSLGHCIRASCTPRPAALITSSLLSEMDARSYGNFFDLLQIMEDQQMVEKAEFERITDAVTSEDPHSDRAYQRCVPLAPPALV